MSKYAAECAEWQQIAQELAQKYGVVVAGDVSDEQRRRMMLRGEQPMTCDEILAEAHASNTEK